MKNSFRLTAAILAVIAVCLCLFLTACKDAVTPNDTKASDTTGTPDTPRASDASDTTGEPDTSAASDSSTATDTETDAASGSATSEKPEPTEPVVKKAVIAGGGASTKIYSEIVRLSGKKNPRVVLLCTAGKDTVSNVEAYTNTFRRYTNNIEAITLVTKLYDPQELHDKIVNADIICVGGGQSEYMDMVWKKYKVDEYLTEAYNRGVVCCGGSAGGMCWTYMGWNDYYSLPDSIYKFFPGLDLINIYYGPHFASSDKWAEFDSAIMKEKNPKYKLGFAMDNGAAIVFIDGQPTKSVRENSTARIFRYDFKDGKWVRSIYKD